MRELPDGTGFNRTRQAYRAPPTVFPGPAAVSGQVGNCPTVLDRFWAVSPPGWTRRPPPPDHERPPAPQPGPAASTARADIWNRRPRRNSPLELGRCEDADGALEGRGHPVHPVVGHGRRHHLEADR